MTEEIKNEPPLNVGRLKKQLENVPDDASVCLLTLNSCTEPKRLIWCIKDNGVVITDH